MFRELFPILTTAALDPMLRFYRDLLDGRVTYSFDGESGPPVYVGLDIGGSAVGIAEAGDAPPAGGRRPIALWVYTDDCDAAVQRLRVAGVEITAEPADQPWGERVARVLDPDGNEVIIGQRGEPTAAP